MNQQTTTTDSLEAWLRSIIQGLVRKPDAVRIASHEAGGTIYLQIGVDEREIGMVVGRGGATYQALKELVKCAGLTAGQRVFLEAHIQAVESGSQKARQIEVPIGQRSGMFTRTVAAGAEASDILTDFLSAPGIALRNLDPKHIRALMAFSAEEAADVRAYVLGMFAEELKPESQRALQDWQG